jgi:hypothetical protein
MPIKYALFGKNITSDSDDYAAMVQIGGSADGADLAQDIIDQGSTMNEPGILAVAVALKLACRRRAEQASLDKLCAVMSPGKTVSKLRSPPPRLTWRRRSHSRGRCPTSPGCMLDLTGVRTGFNLLVSTADPAEHQP